MFDFLTTRMILLGVFLLYLSIGWCKQFNWRCVFLTISTALMSSQFFFDFFPILDRSSSFLSVIQIIGLILAIMGTILAASAALMIDINKSIAGQAPDEKQELLTTGVYSLSRNPIYMGNFLIFLGFELLLNSWLFLGAFVYLVVCYFTIDKEEYYLLERYGENYGYYLEEVPRFISARSIWNFFRTKGDEK